MWRADTVTLIAENPRAHGLFDEAQEITTDVLCTVGSVTRTEAYTAMSAGHAPEYVIRIAHAFDYDGQKTVIFRGVRWRVIRAWQGEGDGVELTIERANRGDTP